MSLPAASQPSGTAWADHLPRLLDLLNGLAQHAVDDTNAASIAFLSQLKGLEDRVASDNISSREALDRMREIDQIAKAQEAERTGLSEALRDAIHVAALVQTEVIASRATFANMEATLAQVTSALAGHEADSPLKARLSPQVAKLEAELAAIKTHLRSTGLPEDPHGMQDRLAAQGTLLREMDAKLAKLAKDYSGLIAMKREQRQQVLESGQLLETAIRGALASAQTGDIIRQQIETVMLVLQQLREVAANSVVLPDIGQELRVILDGLSKRYVMRSQHLIHHEVMGDGIVMSDEEPRMELF